ncbi:MAG: glycosyltransferase [Proteobacteria bacterium]|nr:MAG: glycosyltransferase [Pseudomonadota bacterium]
MNQKICALVVTYNRPQLLCECLTAIVNQSTSVSEIIILDNYSDEVTLSTLFNAQFIPQYTLETVVKGGVSQFEYVTNSANKIKIHYYRLPQNTGGAGGFNAGMRYFYQKTDCDFLWLMDDDSKPDLNALHELVVAYNKLSPLVSLGYICSQVRWIDDSPCRMASPKLLEYGGIDRYSESNPVIRVQNSSFVSLFIIRKVVNCIGLPYKEFFIWADDLEYTSRINKSYVSYVALKSIVVHHTKHNQATSLDAITESNFFKYKYGLRNELFFLRQNNKLRAFSFFIKKTFAILTSEISIFHRIKLLCALSSGFIFVPEIEFPNDI